MTATQILLALGAVAAFLVLLIAVGIAILVLRAVRRQRRPSRLRPAPLPVAPGPGIDAEPPSGGVIEEFVVDESVGFAALVERSRVEWQHKTANHALAWGLTRARADFMPHAGQVVFRAPDGLKATCPVQMIGTYSYHSRAFLWSWANKAFGEEVTEHARRLRTYGQKNSVERLTTATLDSTPEEAETFMVLACMLSNAQGAVSGPIDDGSRQGYMTFGAPAFSREPGTETEPPGLAGPVSPVIRWWEHLRLAADGTDCWQPEPADRASDYGRLVSQGLTQLALATREHESAFGLSRAPFEIDREAGRIAFRSPSDGRAHEFGYQVIGFFSPHIGAWVWGWGHGSVPVMQQRHVRRLREYGVDHGIDDLTTRALRCSEDAVWDYMAFTHRVRNCCGAYALPYANSWMYVTLTEARPGSATP